MDRKQIAELAKNRIGKARQKQESKMPARTGAQVLQAILDEEEEKEQKPQVVLYLKDGLNGASKNWTKYPNEIHDLIVNRLDPFEALLYLRLWRDSWGYNRNYCRHSHSKTMTLTCIKSIGTARRALEGLIKKRFIVRSLRQDNGKQDTGKEGSLYRVFTPQEILNGVTEEGVLFEDIPDNGVICVIMISEIIDKNQEKKHSGKGMIKEINDHKDHDLSDHDQKDQSTMISEIMTGEIIDKENIDKIRHSNLHDHIDHDLTDQLLKDNEDNLKDTFSQDQIVDLFYNGINQEKISKQKRERAEINIEKLLEEGFTLEDIQFAVKWTLENAKEEPYDFSIINHTIGQAMAEKGKAEKKEAEKIERERMLAEKRAEEEKQEELIEKIKEYKSNLDDNQRRQLREEALNAIRNTKGIREEFITEILIEAKENELITAKF